MSQCKKIKLINNKNDEKEFISMSEASKYMNYNKGYISEKIKKGIYKNENYKWEIIK